MKEGKKACQVPQNNGCIENLTNAKTLCLGYSSIFVCNNLAPNI